MDLHNIDVVADDENLVIFLLCSLSSSYKNFRETFLYERENLSSDDETLGRHFYMEGRTLVVMM